MPMRQGRKSAAPASPAGRVSGGGVAFERGAEARSLAISAKVSRAAACSKCQSNAYLAWHAQHLRLLHPHQIDQRSPHPGLASRNQIMTATGFGSSDGDRVRLLTRNGYDWTRRYPWIVESASAESPK